MSRLLSPPVSPSLSSAATQIGFELTGAASAWREFCAPDAVEFNIVEELDDDDVYGTDEIPSSAPTLEEIRERCRSLQESWDSAKERLRRGLDPYGHSERVVVRRTAVSHAS